MPGWLTPAAVAEYLGDATLTEDPNLETVCVGLEAYLERIRVDVFGGDPPPITPTVPADLELGAILWAAHSYQVRSAPSGFTGYGDGAGDTMFDLSLASNRTDIYRLTGLKRPVAL